MPGRDGIPSVTEILSDVGLGWQGWRSLTPERLTFLRARGKAVHALLQRLGDGEVLADTLHEAVAKPVAAYRRWARDVGHKALSSELEMIHSSKLFMGHIDRVGDVQGQSALVDFKVTAAPDLPAATYQLGGYHRLLAEVLSPQRVFIVALNPETGDYRQHDLTDSVEASLHIWDAALIVHHARRGR